MATGVRCDSCRGTSFRLQDGNYYCNRCNAQSELLIEYETNEVDPHMALRGPAAKRAKTQGALPFAYKKFYVSGFDLGPIKHWTDNRTGDYSPFFRQLGRRLTLFCRLVCQVSTILQRDFNAPASIQKVSFFLLQRYFSTFGIAFCDSEIAEDGANGVKFIRKRTKQERMELKQQKKKLDETIAQKQRDDLNKTRMEDIWGFLNTTEVELTKKENELKEQRAPVSSTVQLLEEFNSKLSLSGTQAASKIYLGVDVVIALVFLAAQLTGATWITLWDIFRWYREGRIPISAAQLHGLSFAAGPNLKPQKNLTRNVRNTQTGSHPLGEYFKTLIYIGHATDIPAVIPTCPFRNLAKRVIWNLNLPAVFLTRIDYLISKLSEPNFDIGKKRITDSYPTHPDFVSRVLNDSTIGAGTYFAAIFPQEEKKQHNNKPGRTAFLSAETRTFALILLALKLIFGLDGRERKLQDLDPSCPRLNFDFMDWFVQLRLRMMTLKGKNVKTVLSTQISEDIADYQYDRSQVNPNRYDFKDCIPHRGIYPCSKKLFYEVLTEDVGEQIYQKIEDEALYLPLRFQATLFHDWKTQSTFSAEVCHVDPEKERVFFENYESRRMDYALSLEKTDLISKRSRMFPCMRDYATYPMPLGLRFTNSLSAFALRISELEAMLSESTPFFHPTFRQLLELFALYLGEEVCVLYFAFRMVEYSLINPFQTGESKAKCHRSLVTAADALNNAFQRYW